MGNIKNEIRLIRLQCFSKLRVYSLINSNAIIINDFISIGTELCQHFGATHITDIFTDFTVNPFIIKDCVRR